MSVIIAGQSGATWGLNPQVGMIAQSSEADANIDENPSENADGEVEMTSFFNPTRAVEIGGILLGDGYQLGVAMSAAAALLLGSPSGTIWCTGVRTTGVNTGFFGFHIRGKQYDLF